MWFARRTLRCCYRNVTYGVPSPESLRAHRTERLDAVPPNRLHARVHWHSNDMSMLSRPRSGRGVSLAVARGLARAGVNGPRHSVGRLTTARFAGSQTIPRPVHKGVDKICG